MESVLDMAKVTSKGQVTIPVSVRRAIGVREGDKVLFVRRKDGTISLFSSNLQALRTAQEDFSGAAEEAGLRSSDDVAQMISDLRAEKR